MKVFSPPTIAMIVSSNTGLLLIGFPSQINTSRFFKSFKKRNSLSSLMKLCEMSRNFSFGNWETPISDSKWFFDMFKLSIPVKTKAKGSILVIPLPEQFRDRLLRTLGCFSRTFDSFLR